MVKDDSVVAVRCGGLQLFLGNDVGVTATEMVVAGDQTRLAPRDLGASAGVLGGGADPNFSDAMLVIDPAGLREPGEVDVDVQGAQDSPLAIALQNVNPELLQGFLVEAAFTARRQRLADAADELEALTTDEARIIGNVPITGNPLLTELRAERRRALGPVTTSLAVDDRTRAAVDELVRELRAAVRFGAAGFCDTGDNLDRAVKFAFDDGGWAVRLRLLLAAEEVSAIEWLADTRSRLLAAPDSEMTRGFTDLLSAFWAQRHQALALVDVLDGVLAQLDTLPRSRIQRVVRRKAGRDALVLRETALVYCDSVKTIAPSNDTTWDEATTALLALDSVTSAAQEAEFEDDAETAQSIDDAAEALGELFAQQLPAARASLDELKRRHPDLDADGVLREVKRLAVRDLATATRRNGGEPLHEIVALLAMQIAVLRGIAPRTSEEFTALGTRIIKQAKRIAALNAQAGGALPLAFQAIEPFLRAIQPIIVEALFRRMGAAAPTTPGAARDFYKAARKKVWGARYDKGVGNAAADGASRAFLGAINAGAPRLIVLLVDRSLRAPKRPKG